MINWMHFPKNQPLDKISAQVVEAFENVAAEIDSYTFQYKSDDVLSVIRPKLEALGFSVEKSKKSDDLVAVPVLYGVNGKIEKSFEADGYLADGGYVIEIEAGRAVVNYQFLKDFLRPAQWSALISFVLLCGISIVHLMILNGFADSLRRCTPVTVLGYRFPDCWSLVID